MEPRVRLLCDHGISPRGVTRSWACMAARACPSLSRAACHSEAKSRTLAKELGGQARAWKTLDAAVALCDTFITWLPDADVDRKVERRDDVRIASRMLFRLSEHLP